MNNRAVNPLYSLLDIPADIDTLAGIDRLISEHASESRHLDFKRQLGNVDDLADDLCAMANVGGGVLVIGIGTDRADRAVSLHEQDLRTVEQQAVQAARDGVDEPLRIEAIPVPGAANPATGFLVVAVPPSGRVPHITVSRGRILHRVGTHNKPMTRREIGAAFAAAGEVFAIEFGLAQSRGGTTVMCEIVKNSDDIYAIKVTNTGAISALGISIDSTTSPLLWNKDAGDAPDAQDQWRERFKKENYVPDPHYLPIRALPPGSAVYLWCLPAPGAPQQDVLEVTWKTPDGQVHLIEQSWTWA
jgi:hypothetical protein